MLTDNRRGKSQVALDDEKRTVIGGICNYRRVSKGCESGEIDRAFTYLNDVCGLGSAGWVEVAKKKVIFRRPRGSDDEALCP